LHWFFGTGFLFGVAVFVALCREVVRPGVIWFIRDPNDPQFHPIREMIERPTLPLLQKIVHSAMMYAGLIIAAVGSVVYSLDYLTTAFPLVVPLE
jgi:E3 ubiquitin-protein ligase DOA10